MPSLSRDRFWPGSSLLLWQSASVLKFRGIGALIGILNRGDDEGVFDVRFVDASLDRLTGGGPEAHPQQTWLRPFPAD